MYCFFINLYAFSYKFFFRFLVFFHFLYIKDCELFTTKDGIITETFKKAEEKLLPQIEDSEEERFKRIFSNEKSKSRTKFLKEQEEIFEK